MTSEPRAQLLESPSARERLAAAVDFTRSFAPGTEILVVGATREAVDDLVRRATGHGATFGLHRFSFWQLVSTLAAVEVATEGLAPATLLAAQSVAARAAFEARKRGLVPRLEEVSLFPGFAASLSATLEELRMEGLGSRELRAEGVDFAELAELADLFEQEIEQARIADRAALLKLATWAWRRPQHASLRAAPLLLADVPVTASRQRDFLRGLLESAPAVLATVPAGDRETRTALESLGAKARESGDPSAPRDGIAPGGDGDAVDSLDRLRRWLFSDAVPPAGTADDTVRFFSAPGEARECVEVARLILAEARRGVSFDDVAVLLRAPELYSAHLETALRRAGVPAYFARGTKRPDPAGRAYLALLACASEGFSAKRFAEYLSFAQVPDLNADGAPPDDDPEWVGARDETLGPTGAGASAPGADGLQMALPFSAAAPPAAVPEPPPAADAPALYGTLRVPWRWEKLLVEAAVIGGRKRWQRRLRGLEVELRHRIEQLRGEEPDSPRAAALERDHANLRHLERFALPILDVLAGFPPEAPWGDWLDQLEGLAPRVLRRPARVLEVLAEMRPMSAVGPVSLEEVRVVLADRLSTLEEDPPATRYGRVFVGTPEAGRGRSFRTVFAPGLAERLFPRRPREDPLLLDELRRRLSDRLHLQEDRDAEERMRLRLAVGGAEERLVLSYPRLEVAEARPRVPSFYGLDVARAVRGTLPDHEELERDAEREVQARLAWPSPPDPDDAIDAVEHDLAVLGPLLHDLDAGSTKGRARYLLDLNAHLARSLRARWIRWRFRGWEPQDGIVRVTEETREALAAHRPSARAYSVTALEKYAACPYRFLLGAIHRLEPREEALAPVRLDPLTRGRLFHEVQATALRALRDADALPVRVKSIESATRVLDGVLDDIASTYREDIAPAIPRVWEDEIVRIRADLRVWLRGLARDADEWTPAHFELTFGLPAGPDAEPGSVRDPVEVAAGWKLRGAVDLVERRTDGSGLRITDHKTGLDRTNPGFVVGAGETLQPVLYSLVAEAALGEKVDVARLSFCTRRGGFRDRVVEINDWSRLQGKQALDTIARALDLGLFPPAPRPAGRRQPVACAHCDFRSACGPHEEIRARRKDPGPLAELRNLRELP